MVEQPAAPAYPEPTPAPASITIPVAEKAPAMPAPSQVAVADLGQAIRESGLQLVETRADAKVELAPEREFVPAKRERRPPPPDLNTALVQVETSKEDTAPSPN